MPANYPAGFTQREHDAVFGPPSEESRYGNEETCYLCGRDIIQDTFDRVWYFLDDVESEGFANLSYSKAVDPFQTQKGWVCSRTCWNENCEEHEIDAPGKPFLVRRSA